MLPAHSITDQGSLVQDSSEQEPLGLQELGSVVEVPRGQVLVQRYELGNDSFQDWLQPSPSASKPIPSSACRAVLAGCSLAYP